MILDVNGWVRSTMLERRAFSAWFAEHNVHEQRVVAVEDCGDETVVWVLEVDPCTGRYVIDETVAPASTDEHEVKMREPRRERITVEAADFPWPAHLRATAD